MLVYIILIASITAMLVKPFKWPEVVWVVAGAVLLIVLGLISPGKALEGALKGHDVYFFLMGMMLLAELAREERLFDWLAAYACRHAGGSPTRLFFLIYFVGVWVTTFLSNDATAVVLTPAVAAAVRAAKVKDAIPYLLICAFVSNAASFVLPIANPANLVIYGNQLPSLMAWLSRFFLPSALAISVTGYLLFRTQRKKIRGTSVEMIPFPPLPKGGILAAFGILTTAVILIVVSVMGLPVGLLTFVASLLTATLVFVYGPKNPKEVIKAIDWSIIALVAGLFVMVETLEQTGVISLIHGMIQQSARISPTATGWLGGSILALVSNLTNNLPSGLLAGHVLQAGPLPPLIKSYMVIAVDLGPNLSVTGSLATLLWLGALRREGEQVSAIAFLKLGIILMLPALFAAFAGLWVGTL